MAAPRPHVVLLDLKLTAGPQTDGLGVCRRLCAAHPGLGVLVLTTFAEDRLVVESVQAARAATSSRLSGGVSDRERLTERELDVLRLLARGLSNRAIGAELFISQTTVEFHVGNLMRKQAHGQPARRGRVRGHQAGSAVAGRAL